MTEKVQGPASYFPSIENKYGHPVQHWFDLISANCPDLKHMEQVKWLQTEHEMGQGHANAIVHVWRAKNL